MTVPQPSVRRCERITGRQPAPTTQRTAEDLRPRAGRGTWTPEAVPEIKAERPEARCAAPPPSRPAPGPSSGCGVRAAGSLPRTRAPARMRAPTSRCTPETCCERVGATADPAVHARAPGSSDTRCTRRWPCVQRVHRRSARNRERWGHARLLSSRGPAASSALRASRAPLSATAPEPLAGRGAAAPRGRPPRRRRRAARTRKTGGSRSRGRRAPARSHRGR